MDRGFRSTQNTVLPFGLVGATAPAGSGEEDETVVDPSTVETAEGTETGAETTEVEATEVTETDGEQTPAEVTDADGNPAPVGEDGIPVLAAEGDEAEETDDETEPEGEPPVDPEAAEAEEPAADDEEAPFPDGDPNGYWRVSDLDAWAAAQTPPLEYPEGSLKADKVKIAEAAVKAARTGTEEE